MDMHHLRVEYKQRPLRRESLLSDPFEQFKFWLQEAIDAEEIEPNGMALATVGPSCRHVLLKGIDKTGFIFFTNLNSRKAQQLTENPHVAASFWWRELERQVCLEGSVEAVSEEIAGDYFAKRPRTSRLAAWASEHQSDNLSSRETLEIAFEQIKKKFQDQEVPLPSFWGGFRIIPTRMEFWQGRPNRLHDRFVYMKHETEWMIHQLYP